MDPNQSAVEQAERLLRPVLDASRTVSRFDASFLDDLPAILHEGADAGQLRPEAHVLLRLAGLKDPAQLAALPGALRELGVKDADWQPARSDDRLKRRMRYTKAKGWKDGAGVQASSVESVERVNRLQADYSFQISGGNQDVDFAALSRPATGDPWTPLITDLVRRRVIGPDEPALTIGPRWAGEIRYFRTGLGLRQAIGLDLVSKDPELVKVGDMHNMPFADNTFGLVYQRNTFDKSYDIRKALAECVRVLRDGGVLISDDCLGYTIGVNEMARTNMPSNDWMRRALGKHVAEVLYDRETPSGEDWFERIGQVAFRIRKSAPQ